MKITFELDRPYLDANCPGSEKGICRDPNCTEAVKQGPTGWYITLGHAGFNSPTNNRMGYRSEAQAKAAWKKFGGGK